ncbi:MAG: arylamine N-acetyltransferase [Gammaproteobacteria bacterium]|nr:arylamine N-acetyltransferase [Gammaproteobacteria bacterium]
MAGVDVDAYFRRIGHDASGAPTLATLRALHRHHPLAIPFENLTTLIGQTPPLDAASLQHKMVTTGRGGYCFEQNHLFSAVLRTLGYKVTGLAARVLWERADDALTPRTHMLLAVRISGRTYISDVGFGGLTLTAPLLLEPGIEQTTPHETFRLMSANRGFVLQARLGDEWRSLYWFDLQEHHEIDFEVLNHFVATYPGSPFPSQLYAARTLPDRRLGLRNERFSVYGLDGSVERTVLADVPAVRSVLMEHFGLALPADDRLDAALARAISAAARTP